MSKVLVSMGMSLDAASRGRTRAWRTSAGIDPSAVGLEIVEVLGSSKVTHLRYAVKKKRNL